MNKEIRIIMVGGRPFPNYQGVISDIDKIHKIAFIYTSEGTKNFKNLKAALEKIHSDGEKLLDPFAIEINAYDVNDSFKSLLTLREKYPGYLLSIDVTSAPKISSFGAISYIMKDQNSRVIYVDSRNGIIHEFRVKNQSLLEKSQSPIEPPNIMAFLSTYGRESRSNFDIEKIGLSDEQGIKIAKYLVSLKQIGVEFLDAVRSDAMKNKNNFHSLRIITLSSKKFGKILKRLSAMGLFKNVNPVGDKISVKMSEEKFTFLNGKWLDFYVAKIAEETGLFKDTRFSLEIPSLTGASNEVDFIGILQKYSIGAVVIAECKTGRVDSVFNSHELDKLHSVSKMLGGNFVMELFITNRYREHIGKAKLESFEKRAKVRNIEIILGNELPDLSSKLEKLISNFRPL